MRGGLTRGRRVAVALALTAALLWMPGLPAPLAAGLLAGGLTLMSGGGLRRLIDRLPAARGDPGAGSAGALVLGQQPDGRPAHLSDLQLTGHGVILGASGSGKTTTLLRILSEQVRRGRPVVAVDLKGSRAFAEQLAGAAAEAGHPFRLWTLDGPSAWNPLAHGNSTELKDKLMATERFSEPHYRRAAERYLQQALSALLDGRPDQAPTLREVVSLLEPSRLTALARDLAPERRAELQDYLMSLGADQLSAVRGLASRLAILTESHCAPFLLPHAPEVRRSAGMVEGEVDLRAALREPGVVLFSLNSGRYGELAAQVGNLVLRDVACAAGARLEEPGAPPATVAVDEFSALGADHVLGLFARAREPGIAVLLATQELADLDRAAPGLRDQVLGNTGVKIAHRQEVPASAQTIAQIAGTETRWEVTERLGAGGLPLGGWGDPGRERSGLGAGLSLALGRGAWGRGAGATRRQVEQFLVHPNQIKRLRTGEAVVITKLPDARVRTVRVSRVGDAGRRSAQPPPGVTR